MLKWISLNRILTIYCTGFGPFYIKKFDLIHRFTFVISVHGV